MGTQAVRAGGAAGPPRAAALGQPHVGKRKPLLDETKGVRDFRNALVGVGTNGFGSMRAAPSASLAPTPFGNKIEFTGREKGEKTLPSDYPPPVGHMPGYTGHIHASKHIYGKSYGHASRQLVTEAERESGESAAPASSALSASGNLRVSGRLSGTRRAQPPGHAWARRRQPPRTHPGVHRARPGKGCGDPRRVLRARHRACSPEPSAPSKPARWAQRCRRSASRARPARPRDTRRR